MDHKGADEIGPGGPPAISTPIERQPSHTTRITSAFSGRYLDNGVHLRDNAPMESFFASLKKELVHGADFATRAEARAAVVEYIEVFYNNQRRHSSLGYVSPAEYERKNR